MITWLVQWKMSRSKDTDPVAQRYVVGRLLGWVGIALNFFCFCPNI